MRLLPARRTRELERGQNDPVLSLDDYFSELQNFLYNGVGYGYLGSSVTQTAPGQKQEPIGPAYRSLSELAYKSDSVVFACMLTRAMHFSQVRFQFQQLTNGRPGKLFGTQDLALLEEPWLGGTTSDLLARMLTHADLSGNAFVVKRGASVLALLRPDWVTIVIGVPDDVNADAWATDAEILGYVYQPGGPGSASARETFMPDEVAHFAPIPDPEARFRGMSWLTPLIREVMADKAMTTHKLKFHENGATPNLLMKLDVPDLKEFNEWMSVFKEQHEGTQNAYKTIFMAAGADATVIGKDLQQLDFKAVQGAGETRIAAAARTPPVLVGLSEGLQGSALNSGNYQAARRMFADGFCRWAWGNAADSLSRIVNVPGNARLWYDDRDVAFLKEDLKERAEVALLRAQTIRFYVDAGFKPDDVVAAVDADDISLLEHSGLFSVQLQAANAPRQGLFQGVTEPNVGDPLASKEPGGPGGPPANGKPKQLTPG